LKWGKTDRKVRLMGPAALPMSQLTAQAGVEARLKAKIPE